MEEFSGSHKEIKSDDDDDDEEGLSSQSLHVGSVAVQPKKTERFERAAEESGKPEKPEMPNVETSKEDSEELSPAKPGAEAAADHESADEVEEGLTSEEEPQALRMVIEQQPADDEEVVEAFRAKAHDAGELETSYEEMKDQLAEGLDPELVEAIENNEEELELADIVEPGILAREAEFDPDGDGIIFDSSAELPPEMMTEIDEPDDELGVADHTTGTPHTGTNGGGTATPPPHHGGGGFGGGGGGMPHGPGGPPFGPHFGGGPGGPGGGFGGPNFNAFPVPVPTPNRAPVNPAERIDDGGNAAAGALLGAVVGYFYGRRRGRIKAEKQAEKVQKKLKKQIEGIQWELNDKETKLRRLAKEQVKQNGPTVIERITALPVATRTVEARQTREVSPAPALRQRAPEAYALHGSQKAPEQIGHVLVAAEAPKLIRQTEATPVNVARTEIVPRVEAIKVPPERHVEKMSDAELLSFGERIIVNGSSLRQIYESHLIGEHGLRRLVAEHLRGGDLKKALRREVVEREIDFERDPAMRDVAVGAGPVATGGGKATLNRLVEKASARVVDAPNEQLAFYKARAQYETKQHEQEQHQHKIIDIALGTVITVLTGLIIVLYLTHR
jgi:hypothetical protein